MQTLVEQSTKEIMNEVGNVEEELKAIKQFIHDYPQEMSSFLTARNLQPLTANEVSSLETSLKQFTAQIDAKLDKIASDVSAIKKAIDTSPAAVRERKADELKKAWEKCHYFENIEVIRNWRKEDPYFEIFAAYQKRFRKEPDNKTDLLNFKGKPIDPVKFSYKKFQEINNSFRAVKDFMFFAKKVTSEEIQGIKFANYYFKKEDFDCLLGLKKPHVYYFLDLVQHIDKVNGNCTELPPRSYLPNGQAVKSSWAEPGSARPGLYKWVEEVWDFQCDPSTAFVDDNKPVMYGKSTISKPSSSWGGIFGYFSSSADVFVTRPTVLPLKPFSFESKPVLVASFDPKRTSFVTVVSIGIAFTVFRKFVRR
jgi:flagellar biosynthesis chaperone FliJ